MSSAFVIALLTAALGSPGAGRARSDHSVAFGPHGSGSHPGGHLHAADSSASFERLLRQGDEAFAARGQPGRIEAARGAYAQAAALLPGDMRAELGLARAEAFRAESEPSGSAAAWAEVSRAAERALRRLSPDWASCIDRGGDPARAAALVPAAGAEPLYWLGRASLSGAQARGPAAVLAVRASAIAALERALALDERIDFAGPHRALGAWLAMLPAGAGGGAAAARAHFDRARALYPDYALTAVREAETYAVLAEDVELFEALLGGVLAASEGGRPEAAPENQLAKRTARALLEKKDQLF